MKALSILRIILVNTLWFAFMMTITWLWCWFTDAEKDMWPHEWDELRTNVFAGTAAIGLLFLVIDAVDSIKKILKKQ